MARANTWLRVSVLIGLGVVASCGRWSDDDWDDDDDDEDEVEDERALDRTPAPGIGWRDASVDAADDVENADASPDDDSLTTEDASVTPDVSATCNSAPRCRFRQLYYPLPPEHGCVVVAVDCPFGCIDEGGARCADPPADGPCATGTARFLSATCVWTSNGLCFERAEQACACEGCNLELCSLANPLPRLPGGPPLQAYCAVDVPPVPTATATASATPPPPPVTEDAGPTADPDASVRPRRLSTPR